MYYRGGLGEVSPARERACAQQCDISMATQQGESNCYAACVQAINADNCAARCNHLFSHGRCTSACIGSFAVEAGGSGLVDDSSGGPPPPSSSLTGAIGPILGVAALGIVGYFIVRKVWK